MYYKKNMDHARGNSRTDIMRYIGKELASEYTTTFYLITLIIQYFGDSYNRLEASLDTRYIIINKNGEVQYSSILSLIDHIIGNTTNPALIGKTQLYIYSSKESNIVTVIIPESSELAQTDMVGFQQISLDIFVRKLLSTHVTHAIFTETNTPTLTEVW